MGDSGGATRWLAVVCVGLLGCGDTGGGLATGGGDDPADVVEPTADVIAPGPDVVDATPDVVEATPDLVDVAPDVVEATPDVVEAIPDVVEATPDVVEAGEPDVLDVVQVDPGPGLCGLGPRAGAPEPVSSSPGKASPWATPGNNDVTLGALEDYSALVPTEAFWKPDYSANLGVETFDVYVPPEYDGSEPYGLITFINAGGSGGQPNGDLKPLLSEHKLVWVAADGVGNPEYSVKRLGWAHMGALRMRELLDIDDTRIYTMGLSGGARHANLLAFQHAETYAGSMPWCGAHYVEPLDQVYETHEPDGHYEFWSDNFVPKPPGEMAGYLMGFDQRYALMTSESDFREGDFFNIFHLGYEADRLAARFLDIPGGHCAGSAEHMRNGLAFVEHPFHMIIRDDFGDGDLLAGAEAGSGFIAVGSGTSEIDGELAIDLGPGESGGALARDRFDWRDRQGATLRVSVDLTAGDGAQAVIGLWPVGEVHLATPASAQLELPADSPGAGLTLVVTRDGAGGSVRVLAGRADDVPLLLFEATLTDWAADSEALSLRLDLWDIELQLTSDRHWEGPTSDATGVRPLKDSRTVIVNLEEQWQASGWPAEAWPSEPGSVLTLAGAAGEAPGSVVFGEVELFDAAGIACAP